jgi:hypothetical protein
MRQLLPHAAMATSFPCAVVASTIVTFMYSRAIGDDECSHD